MLNRVPAKVTCPPPESTLRPNIFRSDFWAASVQTTIGAPPLRCQREASDWGELGLHEPIVVATADERAKGSPRPRDLRDFECSGCIPVVTAPSMQQDLRIRRLHGPLPHERNVPAGPQQRWTAPSTTEPQLGGSGRGIMRIANPFLSRTNEPLLPPLRDPIVPETFNRSRFRSHPPTRQFPLKVRVACPKSGSPPVIARR